MKGNSPKRVKGEKLFTLRAGSNCIDPYMLSNSSTLISKDNEPYLGGLKKWEWYV